MFLQLKSFKVTEGHADKMVERFAGRGVIEEQPGFIDLSVFKKKQRRGDEEVIVLVRWESEENWKAWETSEIHLQGHRENQGKPGPAYILEGNQQVYNMLGQKTYKDPQEIG
ncbi:antibiotic biosynthesis monooxygenase family protein [Bacillus suaedaesalsae]|uniref:Antibiotic biosynthesis monooxygenase n=1 Tax=Bacillus suaedaesalsae TaxID=2810349 RepID=A0ABS2DKE6_9BACI|nr:antibiotic biosynthesis monooxygenase [Bacillus suaedaesalsae]MBM6618944.1 antibiotic biosynthesis monooxygenase [Bacillus suaedaesalsae]